MQEQTSSATKASAPDGLPPERRRWAIIAIFTALAVSSLDSSIANIALPTIAHDMDATPAASIWVVNAYQLAVTVTPAEVAAFKKGIA